MIMNYMIQEKRIMRIIYLQSFLSLHLNLVNLLALFDEARCKLDGHIKNWGFQKSKDDYYQILADADVAVSTAQHEFFGVAM